VGAFGRARTSGVAPSFNLRFLAMQKFLRDRKRRRSMRTRHASFASISCDSPARVCKEAIASLRERPPLVAKRTIA
jgi:hypothetical protein